MELLLQGVDDRTRRLEEEDFTLEPDTSAECELFDTLELILEETVVIVIDADPHLNIYVSAQFDADINDDQTEDLTLNDPPEELFLNISIQENLLENPNVLIYDDEMFEFDDSNEINEDTIVVTGFTVSLDNPLEFTFWEDAERCSRTTEGGRISKVERVLSDPFLSGLVHRKSSQI